VRPDRWWQVKVLLSGATGVTLGIWPRALAAGHEGSRPSGITLDFGMLESLATSHPHESSDPLSENEQTINKQV